MWLSPLHCVAAHSPVWLPPIYCVAGKSVVSREEAVMRVRAAVDATREGADILILARTDARATDSLEEAILRCQMFHAEGAHITFLEAPRNEAEMREYCQRVRGYKMANNLDGGLSPTLPASRLHEIGYSIVAHPTTLLSAAIQQMQTALKRLKDGQSFDELILSFPELRAIVGFDDYDVEQARYQTKRDS